MSVSNISNTQNTEDHQEVTAIYVVQLVAGDGEYFTKVGITRKFNASCGNPFDGLAKRAKGFHPYSVAACEVRVGAPEMVKQVERGMIAHLRAIPRMVYKPQVSFNGSKKECFRLSYDKMRALLDVQWAAQWNTQCTM